MLLGSSGQRLHTLSPIKSCLLAMAPKYNLYGLKAGFDSDGLSG